MSGATTIAITALAAVCIITGGVLAFLMEDKSTAILIITIASGSLIPVLIAQKHQADAASEAAQKANKRAEEAFEETQTLKRQK